MYPLLVLELSPRELIVSPGSKTKTRTETRETDSFLSGGGRFPKREVGQSCEKCQKINGKHYTNN